MYICKKMAQNMIAQHMFSSAVNDVGNKFQEGLSLIESKSSAILPKSSGAGGAVGKLFSCFESIGYSIVDLV